jgi:hypothetical protein
MGAVRSADRAGEPAAPPNRFWNGVVWTEPGAGPRRADGVIVPGPRRGERLRPVPGASDVVVLPPRLTRGPDQLPSHRARRSVVRRAAVLLGAGAVATGMVAASVVVTRAVATVVPGWPLPWP